jgi:quercetin dioxygenase-like cupin family protein
MKPRWAIALGVAALGAAVYGGAVLATPPSGVTTTTFGVGRFDDIDTTTKTDVDGGRATDFWQARLNTKGASDLYVLQNTISPGGTFGWHSHPGPSLVIVKSGTATFYMADDPTCSPHVVTAGQGFVDNGHDTHVVRNEGSVDLVTIVASLVPAGFARRIDEHAPPNCPNLPNG